MSSIESLAGWLTEGAVTSLGPISDQLRLETLQRFARQPRAPRAPVTTSIFYVSYAREDKDDQMTRFISDLTGEVRALTGVPVEQVGYFDWTRLRPGSDFGAQITSAISGSQVGICLLSPSYLRSGYCLREVELFRTQGKPVLPIDWIPVRPDDMPENLREIKPFTAGSQGLRTMLRVKGLQDQYQHEVIGIAHRIVTLTERKTEASIADNSAEVPLIVIAERSDRIRTIRSNVRPYGSRRRDWKPFWSMQGQSAGEIARDTARRTGAKLRLTSLHKARELFLRSRKPHSGAILLIDPWSLLIGEYKELLRGILKRAGEGPVFSFVCFDHDGETRQRRSELETIVLSSVPDSESPRPVTANDREDLERLLDRACFALERPQPGGST